jgi:predicted nucleic acid-binding Zn ribbon protein
MALTHCPECGHAVSGSVSTCPSCEFRLDAKQKQRQTRLILLVVCVALGGLWGWYEGAVPGGTLAGAIVGGILCLLHWWGTGLRSPSKRPTRFPAACTKPPSR